MFHLINKSKKIKVNNNESIFTSKNSTGRDLESLVFSHPGRGVINQHNTFLDRCYCHITPFWYMIQVSSNK